MGGKSTGSTMGHSGAATDPPLSERVHDAVESLASALVAAHRPTDPTRADLAATYRLVLVVVFRVCFLAVAEARGHLPSEDPRYEPHSIHALGGELAESGEFAADSTALWNRIQTLSAAVHDGRAEWGLPAYGGSLFATEDGLASVELTDEQFGPVLAVLLCDDAGRPTDFGSLDLQAVGAVYEELVDSELTIGSEGVALHGRSGERESTGTYYTNPRFVDHLLDHALEPALTAHCDCLDDLGDGEAATVFFDFRVADVAMGSGGFLLAALDRISTRLAAYLDERPLPGVEARLDELAERATAMLEPCGRSPEIDREALLRRLVARQCCYGVDADPLAVTLARTSVWLAAFVPGLSQSPLNRHLVAGDSLTGIGTFAEVESILAEAGSTASQSLIADLRGGVESLADEAESVGKTPTDDAVAADELAATFDVLAAARIDDRVDPAAVGSSISTAVHDYAIAALEPTDPVHFPVAFTEVFGRENPGFDVIVGNPPWEESILDEDAFWTRYAPGLQREESHGGGKAETIARLQESRPDLASRYEREKAAAETRRDLLRNGPYPDMGTGDPDTYKAFCWRNWALLRDGGHLGLVLPRGAFLGAGSADFRRELLESGVVEDLTFLKNRDRWVFEGVGPRFTVGLLAARREPPSEDATLPLRGPFPDPESFEAGVAAEPHRFPVAEALEWTGTTLFPMLPADPRSVGIFETIASQPRLDRDETVEWHARPYRELDETTDKTADDGTTLIHTTDEPLEEECWPVLDGASLNPPDEPGWVMDTGARFGWADPDVLCPHLQDSRENSYRYAGVRSAFAEFPESWIRDPDTLPCLRPRVAFRHVTQRTNRRTICASLVPPEVFLTNAAPYFLWPTGDERDQAYLLGVCNSIPFDWQARLFVEANVNYHILNSLRVPRPGRSSERRRRVESIAGRLAAREKRYADWADAVGVEWGTLGEREEMELVCELDAVVAHLFGLSREDVGVVFETFHRNWDHEERLEGVLKYFDEWAE